MARFAAVAALAIGSMIAAPGAAEAQSKFVFANSSAYDTLDPHAVFDVGRVASRLNLYDGLMRWEDNPPQLQPWLAESYEISDDGLVYTFKLREAKFHDGSPVEASDVVYSIERTLGMKKGAFSLFEAVIKPGSTVALDARTTGVRSGCQGTTPARARSNSSATIRQSASARPVLPTTSWAGATSTSTRSSSAPWSRSTRACWA
jgi:ABC-type transport system substrate-binding protein